MKNHQQHDTEHTTRPLQPLVQPIGTGIQVTVSRGKIEAVRLDGTHAVFAYMFDEPLNVAAAIHDMRAGVSPKHQWPNDVQEAIARTLAAG